MRVAMDEVCSRCPIKAPGEERREGDWEMGL
jgi:hypothetical protein